MDVIQWSVPFLCDCVTKMLYACLSQHNDIYDGKKETLDDDEKQKEEIDQLLKRRHS